MKIKWKLAAAARALAQLKIRRKIVTPPGTQTPVVPEDIDTLEDVLATIRLPIGLLNMDYAGNNIRNIAKAREVMANPAQASGKQKSELKLLGFMERGTLTALGRAAARVHTNAEVARLWCAWLRHTPDPKLRGISEKLLVAKRVLPQFWRLKQDVRDFFLQNAQDPTDRETMQTIELLCNARNVVQELSLDDMKTLSALLRSDRIPEYVRSEVTDYFENKGQRSWKTDDRSVVPLAWKETEP